MAGHSMIIPPEVLENLHDAIEILKKKMRIKMNQPIFIEYLFETEPQKIADMVYENYMKRLQR
jgi:hypothetical protein